MNTWNKQGRTVSGSMRLASFKAFLKTQAQDNINEVLNFEGYAIRRFKKGGHWFIDGWANNGMHLKLDSAKTAITRCLEIRQLTNPNAAQNGETK